MVTDNTKGAGRKIREKGRNEIVEIRVFSFMGSLIFFGMEKMPSEPQHKHHKLVIASEFTRIQLEFLNITESSK